MDERYEMLLKAAIEANRCMTDQTSLCDGSFENAQEELERCIDAIMIPRLVLRREEEV